MITITDLRILKAIEKRYNCLFDRKFKYCLKEGKIGYNPITYKNKQYALKYFSGCFYPYLIEVLKK